MNTPKQSANRLTLAGAVVLVLALASITPAVAWGQSGRRSNRITFSDEAVNQAIKRGVEYIWSKYRPDRDKSPWAELRWTWDNNRQGQGDYMQLKPTTNLLLQREQKQHYNYGGYTALAVYALLTCGESPSDPRMKRAIDWLMKIDCMGTYSLGVRAQIWAQLHTPEARKLLRKEARHLVKSPYMPPQGFNWRRATWEPHRQYGSYDYLSTGKPSLNFGCNSNTQFANLGVWTAARSGEEVPSDYWRLVYNHWITAQKDDGGWCYSNKFWPQAPQQSESRTSMTLAGIASLFVAIDHLDIKTFVSCGKKFEVPAIQKGMTWLAKKGKLTSGNGYNLYGLERVGLATGYKYIGGIDWYKAATTKLINRQQPAGNWLVGSTMYRGAPLSLMQDNCFNLIFLARGRNPLMFNRLQYKGDWNNRPRALANLTAYVSKQFEREINWQIVNIDTSPTEWHDSQLLLISGSDKPEFDDAELDKIRQFVHQGGTLLSVAECGGRGRKFDAAMREYYGKLFGDYELQLLGAEHPIYSIHFPIRLGRKIWAVSNGVRVLAFHTTEDLIAAWQVNARLTAKQKFQLPTNIYIYVNEKGMGRARGAFVWPKGASRPAQRTVNIARIKYAGNWDPEPGAWQRMKLLLAGKWGTKARVKALPVTDLNAGQWTLATITGTGSLALSADERKALKAYVAAGGTVLIDAAGGNEDFAASVMTMLNEMYGELSVQRMSPASPLYNLPGMKIKQVKYRRAALVRTHASKAPRLRAVYVDDRPAVLVSAEDLTVGLVGCPAYGCVGYQSKSAVEIVRNIVHFAASDKSRP